MYTYYILYGTQAGEPAEIEGDIDAEQFPNIDLNDGKAILQCLVERTNREESSVGSWERAELTNAFFDREDTYIFFDGRWMRHADAPWRKDRAN